jgi:hypothetical protein
MNTETSRRPLPGELGSEILDLVKHLLMSEGRRFGALGDGLIYFSHPRPHPDAPISFIVFYDREKWSLLNADGKGRERNSIQVSLPYLSGPSTSDVNYDTLVGFLGVVLKPRTQTVHFYKQQKLVDLKEVVAVLRNPTQD